MEILPVWKRLPAYCTAPEE